MTLEELKKLIRENIASEESKKTLSEIIKAEVERLSMELGVKPTIGRSQDIEDAFNYVPQEIGHGYVKTREGSILNLNNPQAPWVYVGESTKRWAKAFIEYCRTGNAPSELVKDMSEGTDSAGGYLVPDEFRAMIVMSDIPGLVIWPGATVWPMTRLTLGIPKLDQDVANDSYFAGVSFTWTDEGGDKTETEPTFDFITLTAHELSGYTALTDALLDDSAVNLMNFLTNLFGKAWYWTTDRAFIQGSGGSTQPLGILNDPNVITVNRTTASTVTVDDVLAMEAALPSVFDANAVWIGSKAVRSALRGQKDDNGALILTESFQQSARGAETRLLGYPFLLADGKVSSLGTTGDLILCDRSQYYIGDRKRFSMDVSKHYLFKSNKTAIRVVGRVDGQPAISDAFVVLGSTSS